MCWQAELLGEFVEFEADAAVEFEEVVEVEELVVAATTQGPARSTVAIAIPASAVSCAVLVFILFVESLTHRQYLLNFRNRSIICSDSTQEESTIEVRNWCRGIALPPMGMTSRTSLLSRLKGVTRN